MRFSSTRWRLRAEQAAAYHHRVAVAGRGLDHALNI